MLVCCSYEQESGTASQEINFWISMERALALIDEQLKSDPIVLTLEILKTAKRFLVTGIMSCLIFQSVSWLILG
jgi:hypothetical protein